MKEACNKKNGNGLGRIGLILILSLAPCGIAYIVYQLVLAPGPAVNRIEAFDFSTADKTITFQGKNLKSLEISAHQGGREIGLLKDTPGSGDKTYTSPSFRNSHSRA